MSTENKFDTSAFIAKYMDAYGQEPSYEVVVNAAVEQLKFENDQLKKLMSVQLDMLKQNKQMSAEIEHLKKENLLLSDDRELYMRHREILIGALNTIAFEGSSREYCTKISEQALKEIGEI